MYGLSHMMEGGGRRFRRKWRQTNRKKEMNDVCEGVWYSNIFDFCEVQNMIYEKTYEFKGSVQMSKTDLTLNICVYVPSSYRFIVQGGHC